MAKNSNTVKGKRRTAPHKGQFQKGDKRINRNGQMSNKRLAFNKELRELIVKEGETIQAGTIGEKSVKLKKVEWLIKSVWKKAIDGEAWAVNFIAERVEGKVMQPIEGEISLLYQISDKFMPKTGNDKK